MTDNSSTLERLVPDLIEEGDATGRETLLLHLKRYEFAAKYFPFDAEVVDIACRVGYGTRLMADKAVGAKHFPGVDLSNDSINYAKRCYQTEKVDFLVADAMKFKQSKAFDVAVSLETIEHLPQPELFLGSILESVKSSGIFIGSVPTTPSVDANPHHLHDFTAKSFRAMLEKHGLDELDSLEQVQPFNPFKIIGRKEKRLSDMRSNLLAYYIAHPRSLFKRLASTAIDGFNNNYLTVVARKL